MEMLDKNHKFQFIRNAQVIIDKDLLKYQLLEVRKKKKSIHQEEGEMLSSQMVRDVDRDVVKFIKDNGLSRISEFLGSDDAKDFNLKYEVILGGEVSINKYSTTVYSDRILPYSPEEEKVIKTTLKDVLRVIKDFITPSKPKEDTLDLKEFFGFIHAETSKEKEVMTRLDSHFGLLERALKMGQTAQVDEICQSLVISIYESILGAHGYNKYIEFSELEKCWIPGAKAISIDYIKNFGRVIPGDIVDKKVFLDSLCVFDNYCVMYYDPTGKTYKVPESQKRDPVLFGLINHSPKLYYIGDWTDNLCDLTLDTIAKTVNVGDLP